MEPSIEHELQRLQDDGCPHDDTGVIPCERCGGTGRVVSGLDFFGRDVRTRCPVCGGTGEAKG